MGGIDTKKKKNAKTSLQGIFKDKLGQELCQ